METETEAETASEPGADDARKPLSERLVTELTAHRTLALRDALANAPSVAFVAVLHTLCLHVFYRMPSRTCLDISARSVNFNLQAPRLADSTSAHAINARQQLWASTLPKDAGDLWPTLMALDRDRRWALFAHCVSLSVNAVQVPWDRSPGRLAHADALARAVNLDMAAAGWSPTVDNYLGRVPKARILAAVREAKGEASMQRIAHLTKPEMAREAEQLLAGTSWLPEPLRTPDAPAGQRNGNAPSAADSPATVYVAGEYAQDQVSIDS